VALATRFTELAGCRVPVQQAPVITEACGAAARPAG
jgi:hypothetical protein